VSAAKQKVDPQRITERHKVEGKKLRLSNKRGSGQSSRSNPKVEREDTAREAQRPDKGEEEKTTRRSTRGIGFISHPKWRRKAAMALTLAHAKKPTHGVPRKKEEMPEVERKKQEA